MTIGRFVNSAIAGLVGAAMLALPLSSASAFTLSSPSLGSTVAAGQIDKVWWGWRGGRWGWWWPGAVVGGVAAGAVVGSALAPRPYYYGPGYYGPCWRWVAGPSGPYWARVC